MSVAGHSRVRRSIRWCAVGLCAVVVLGVAVAYQFPSLTAGRKSSVEVLEDLFRAPVEFTEDQVLAALKGVNKEAVALFIVSHDLPEDAEARLVDLVRSERVDTITLPYVFYLYELYGSPATDAELTGDLAYAETPKEPAAAKTPLSPSLFRRRHVNNALRLFDALFLRVKPGTAGRPVHERYDEQSYQEIRDIVRQTAREMLAKNDDALRQPRGNEDQYREAIQKVLDDDERFADMVEFFADFLRELSDSWLESFVQRQQRTERRLEWVQQRIEEQRYFEIADYAQTRLERKLVFHLAVDGLQGKLLEGLAQLSLQDRQGAGARYVTELVREHQKPAMHPSSYDAGEQVKLPPLGHDIVELVDSAPLRPDYLENFKRHFFAPEAPAVVVQVATVETPTISVRNLPIIYHGHAVAGPYGTGIPNFSYLDRRTARGWYFWGSDVLHFRNIFANREERIPGGQPRSEGPGARTLFERLWRYNTVAALPTVDRGALEKVSAEVGVALGEVQRNFIEKALVLRFRQRAEIERELIERQRWLRDHRHLNHGFLAELIFNAADLKTFREHARWVAEHEDDGLPDYLLWYNPWPDHFAHGKGPYSDEIVGYQGEYDRLDFYLGKMLAVYESVDSAEGRGNYLDRTLVGVVSDHGLIYTPRLVKAEPLIFDGLERDGVRITYRKLSVDEGELPAIHSRHGLAPTRPFDVVVGSTAGGSYVLDLFDVAGIRGDQAAWQRHPDYHQLREHKLLSGQTIDFIAELQQRLAGVMDFAVVREYGPAPGESWPPEVESAVRIVTPNRGEARIVRAPLSAESAAIHHGSHHYRYEILGSQDPLDLAGSIRDYLLPLDPEQAQKARSIVGTVSRRKWQTTDEEWQMGLSGTLRPDCVHQLSHLYDTDRAGTINIFPLPHVGLNSGVPGRHAGETFGEKNGTQLYRVPGRTEQATIHTARNGSLPVTLYHWLVGERVFQSRTGAEATPPSQQFGFPSLLRDPAFASESGGER